MSGYLLKETTIRAKLGMLMTDLGCAVVVDEIQSGAKAGLVTQGEHEDWTHDEKLLIDALAGVNSSFATTRILDLQSRFRTPELRDATKDQIERHYS